MLPQQRTEDCKINGCFKLDQRENMQDAVTTCKNPPRTASMHFVTVLTISWAAVAHSCINARPMHEHAMAIFAKFAKLGGTWLSYGSYGVYMAVTRTTWLIRCLGVPLFFAKIAFPGSYGQISGVASIFRGSQGGGGVSGGLAFLWGHKLFLVHWFTLSIICVWGGGGGTGGTGNLCASPPPPPPPAKPLGRYTRICAHGVKGKASKLDSSPFLLHVAPHILFCVCSIHMQPDREDESRPRRNRDEVQFSHHHPASRECYITFTQPATSPLCD